MTAAELVPVPATLPELRELHAAAVERVNVADDRFAAIAAELWSVPALSARAEQLRVDRGEALATIRRERAVFRELNVELMKRLARA